jgi:hypothetical protein
VNEPLWAIVIGSLVWATVLLLRRRSPSAATSKPLTLLLWVSGCGTLLLLVPFVLVLVLLIQGFGP